MAACKTMMSTLRREKVKASCRSGLTTMGRADHTVVDGSYRTCGGILAVGI